MKSSYFYFLAFIIAAALIGSTIGSYAVGNRKKNENPYIDPAGKYVANDGALCPHCHKRLDQPPVK